MRITRLAVSGLGAGLAAATLAVATCQPVLAAASLGGQIANVSAAAVSAAATWLTAGRGMRTVGSDR